MNAFDNLDPGTKAHIVDTWNRYALAFEAAQAARRTYEAELRAYLGVTMDDLENAADGDWTSDDILWEQHPCNIEAYLSGED